LPLSLKKKVAPAGLKITLANDGQEAVNAVKQAVVCPIIEELFELLETDLGQASRRLEDLAIHLADF